MADNDLSKLRIDKTSAIKRTGKDRKKIIYIAITAAVVSLLGSLFMSGMLSPAIKVQASSASQIYPSQTFTILNASGYIVPQRKASVASKITSRLVALHVQEGSRVKKNDVLAKLEGEDAVALRGQAAANLEQVRAELSDATRSYNRNRELVKQGYIAHADFDIAEARFKKARAQVSAAQAALKGADVAVDYTLIRAPFDAIVLTKNADMGDIVTPLGAAVNAKASVVTLADLDSLQVEVDVSESNIGKIRIGQPCDIQLDALPDMRFRGEAHMIVPTADRSKATVMVKVRFVDKDPRILPEMSAKIAFLSREVAGNEMKSFTAVNKTALVIKDKSAFVYVIQGTTIKAAPVTTGRQMGDMIEILQGVKAGDRVVLKPSEHLRDGSRIKTEEK